MLTLGLTLALTSCAANPGPPPLVEPEEQETTSAAPTQQDSVDTARTQVQVGVDPVRGGFNPHLAGDESAVVTAIADLVLPSAFSNGVRDADLLVAASPLATSPAARTVRYVIAPEAQWSDGTPITGADFAYLWRGMVNTPATVDPAGYRAIARIRVSGPGGKTVDVDFAQPVAQWRDLFTHLLPSHLLDADAGDFAYALRNSVPSSAGHYLMAEVDRARGTITLNRNDRFWGTNPAAIDILTLTAARETTQTADQLRARQLAFAELAPGETTEDVLRLIPGIDVRTRPGPRTLGVVISATSGMSRQARIEGRSLIDAPVLSHIASRRHTDPPAEFPAYPPVENLDALHAHVAAHGPVRVAADASDPAAGAAARSLVDMLVGHGVQARLVSSELHTIAGRGLEDGDVDMVATWRGPAVTPNALASQLECPAAGVRSGNLSGFCSGETEAMARRVLAGDAPVAQAHQLLERLEVEEALWVPVLRETRLAASSGTLPGGWPGSLADAALWQAPAPPGDTVRKRTLIEEDPQ